MIKIIRGSHHLEFWDTELHGEPFVIKLPITQAFECVVPHSSIPPKAETFYKESYELQTLFTDFGARRAKVYILVGLTSEAVAKLLESDNE